MPVYVIFVSLDTCSETSELPDLTPLSTSCHCKSSSLHQHQCEDPRSSDHDESVLIDQFDTPLPLNVINSSASTMSALDDPIISQQNSPNSEDGTASQCTLATDVCFTGSSNTSLFNITTDSTTHQHIGTNPPAPYSAQIIEHPESVHFIEPSHSIPVPLISTVNNPWTAGHTVLATHQSAIPPIVTTSTSFPSEQSTEPVQTEERFVFNLFYQFSKIVKLLK